MRYTKQTGENKTTRFTAPDVRILLVDDIRTNITVAEGFLAPYGMEIAAYPSGVEAITDISDQVLIAGYTEAVNMIDNFPGKAGI